jgi:biopolymer transport protein ExbB
VNLTNHLDGLATLFEQGGMILRVIVVASFYMWYLLAERYWFHWKQLPQLRERLREEWRRQPVGRITKRKFRRVQALVDDLRAEAGRNMLALNALVAILPLLGLLGTVSGMIKVFEVITLFGTGNTRGMASGISEALVTTMAGLFTALSGLYFVTHLETRADDISREFELELVEDQ